MSMLANGGEQPAAKSPPKIRVDRARHGFVDATGKPFVPFGVSYYRPGTGWAPQLWKQFDADATRRDFALLKKQGVNVVRVFISYGSFFTEPGKLNPEGLAKFDQLLDLADEAGIYVHPTGPDHWEGVPAWIQELQTPDLDGNEPAMRALEKYWRLFATRYRGRSTIWAYDLKNEPVVAWDTPYLRTQWEEWRKSRKQEVVSIPDKSKSTSPNLADYQHFRESIGEKYVARLSKAIHAADPDALVTVGLIQWSVPAQRLKPDQYAAFRPSLLARHLDFMELHFYPLAKDVYQYGGAEAETANLAVLEAMARECAKPGLPLVIAEFGWYGGGAPKPGFRPATEEQQAEWCRHLIETTEPMACGWLNWGMNDNPQAAEDISKLTGLFTADGKEKAWGHTFHELAQRFQNQPPVFALPDRPDLPWERCLADGNEMTAFQKAYLESFAAAAAKKKK